MIAKLERSTSIQSIAWFWDNYQQEKFDTSPTYQRGSVWDDDQRSFFIDTIVRNFPAPPIFLRQRINDSDGSITYEVIDGKQRIEAIVKFIKNQIAIINEFDDVEDIGPSGKYFHELTDEYAAYRTIFWRYQLSIEYIDSDDEKTITSIFDRLNRNGVRLNDQELRNAKFAGSEFLPVLAQAVSYTPFSQDLFSQFDKDRMLDKRFASELLFVIAKQDVNPAKDHKIDEIYSEISRMDKNKFDGILKEYQQTMDLLESLNINFDALKINGGSHIYGLWSFLALYKDQLSGVDLQKISATLKHFYENYRNSSKDEKTPEGMYNNSVSYRTGEKGTRRKRVNALRDYFNNTLGITLT